MVYPVGETAKLLGVVKNIREEDVPERFRAIRAELRGVPESKYEYRRRGQMPCSTCPLFVINIFR